MAFLFFHERTYFEQIITKTMQSDTIENHDIRSSSSELYNLISCQPIGNCNNPIIALRSRMHVLCNLCLTICNLEIQFFLCKLRKCYTQFGSSAIVKMYRTSGSSFNHSKIVSLFSIKTTCSGKALTSLISPAWDNNTIGYEIHLWFIFGTSYREYGGDTSRMKI